jgi:ferredoxin
VRAFARTLAAAGLEANGQYDAARHDALFHQLAETPLTREELAPFPTLLVCLREGDLDATARAELIELLLSGAPVKVLLQFDDLAPPPGHAEGPRDVACRADAFTGAALGLGHVFVVQASASALPRRSEEIRRAMAYAGPALFSVFSGATEGASLPPYLHAAAALESRAFPCFAYDPSKPLDSGERFVIDGNPQPDRDWTRHALEFEDREHQRVVEDYAFTVADFLAAHARFTGHFMPLAAGESVAVDAWLDRGDPDGPCAAVCVVDDADTMHRMVVDDEMLERARAARERWRRLQQLAKLGRPVVEAPAPAPAVEAPAPQAAPASAPAGAEPEAPKAPASDEAYIETPRCTTCEECMAINKKMFRYDDNKQAYIADLRAGTYRQLVEAAEACQVSIIHPGKPWDASEAGLEESIERAKPFL